MQIKWTHTRRKGHILKYNLSELSQEETENMNRPITSTETESVNKRPEPGNFTGEFYQTFRDELTPILLNQYKNCKERNTRQNLFYEATVTLKPKPDKNFTGKENYKPVSLMNIDVKFLNKILANRLHTTH